LDTLGHGQVSFTANVTAISGAGANIQFELQASDDGTNWNTVHSTRRFTAAGAHRISGVRISSQYYRYTWVINGTTPSVTFSIATSLKAFSPIRTGSMFRYDDLDLTVLGATSTSYFAAGNDIVSVTVVRPSDGGLVAASYVIEASNDQLNWAEILGRIDLAAGVTKPHSIGMTGFRYYRARVSVAITLIGGSTAHLLWASTGGS
jgi:hypothetical protein